MKALQILKPREFEIVEIDCPTPGAGEVVIKLDYAAICNQNDFKIFYGLYGDLIQYPCDPGVFGHEGVGTVVEIGGGVDSLAEGDRVVMMGEGGPMLYMEYVLRTAESVAKIDASTDMQEAAVLELFGCAHHCLEIAGELRGKRVAISGLGPAGLALLQLARRRGPAEIVGLEPDAARAGLARTFGIDRVIDPGEASCLAALREEGADLVIDATGLPESMRSSFDIARDVVVIFGFTNQPFEVDQSVWFRKELVIRNSRELTIADLCAAAELLAARKIDPGPMISEVMRFRDYDRAVEKIGRGEAVKILLEWR